MAFVTEAVYIMICVLLVGVVFKADAQEMQSSASNDVFLLSTQQGCNTIY